MVFDVETVTDELEELLETEVVNISLNTGWDTEYFEVTVEEEGAEYIVLETYKDAEDLAKEQVEQDLDYEREIFNEDWLTGLMFRRIPKAGMTFIEFASEDAVNTDGFAHFLAHYDGDYQETKSGFIVMRTN